MGVIRGGRLDLPLKSTSGLRILAYANPAVTLTASKVLTGSCATIGRRTMADAQSPIDRGAAGCCEGGVWLPPNEWPGVRPRRLIALNAWRRHRPRLPAPPALPVPPASPRGVAGACGPAGGLLAAPAPVPGQLVPYSARRDRPQARCSAPGSSQVMIIFCPGSRSPNPRRLIERAGATPIGTSLAP